MPTRFMKHSQFPLILPDRGIRRSSSKAWFVKRGGLGPGNARVQRRNCPVFRPVRSQR